MSALLKSASVARVRSALLAHGLEDRILELAATARTAEDAARACGVPVGAIVKSLVFAIDGTPVLALVAGDRRCDPSALPAALNLPGKAGRCDADTVRAATGFAIGGVAPVGHLAPLPPPVRRRRPPALRLRHDPAGALSTHRRHPRRGDRHLSPRLTWTARRR
jgi:prolyl-tRNA editing enzyme YbaK/EbsC (Cys-tRNA(Pro) deacylase)